MVAPLERLVILDLTRLLPGGYATFLLAMLGADVVKVEEPGVGDYVRTMPPFAGEVASAHIALNRNKRSVTLNLKEEEGRVLLRRLAERADVLVESFRPGVMDRLGVGYEDLSERNPRLVYCALTGFGRYGPRASEAGPTTSITWVARGRCRSQGPKGGRRSLPASRSRTSGAL